MRLDKRLAADTALGLDGTKLMDLDRTGIQRRLDPRLRAEQQTGGMVYAGNDNDRGHLVRRAPAVWGDTRAEAARANVNTFHYTNASTQAAAFNQRMALWLGLESYLQDNAAENGRRLVVFTGPIFSDTGPIYRGAQIPLKFFKVAASCTAAPSQLPDTSWTRHLNWGPPGRAPPRGAIVPTAGGATLLTQGHRPMGRSLDAKLFPPGSSIAMCQPSRPSTTLRSVAPPSTQRSAWSRARRRPSAFESAPLLILMSRCNRFFAVLPSGTG